MIRSLTGEVTAVTDGYIVVTVYGVGYLVGCPTKTTVHTIGTKVHLHTYLAVRETALDLYGFVHQSELDLFELLLLVPKIGPKSALQILNQASPTLLLEAIGKKDGGYLHKLSGIGKKTCENIVQFLHDKVENLAFATELTPSNGFTPAQTDAMDALVSLGYDLTSAREAVKNLGSESSTANELITLALKNIS
jgi:Holliday junction DNA helicase RuvA